MPMTHKLIGPRATAAWLTERGLATAPGDRWSATIAFDDDLRIPTCQFHLAIEALEWSFQVSRGAKMSWIRVLEEPRVHERDDFELLARTPALRNLATLVQGIEDSFRVRFRRAHARIWTNLPEGEDKIRLWVVASL